MFSSPITIAASADRRGAGQRKRVKANGSCNMYVNEWAQELIFKVMDVDGEEKQKACHHFGFLFYSKEDKNILICPACGSRIPAQKKSDSGGE
ncbi:MAG: hypothetical protein OIN87_05800 [Candidatus Methanoperedens sp.]|nr:hypothetical protein [Candidatus Methanoperedens sp.]